MAPNRDPAPSAVARERVARVVGAAALTLFAAAVPWSIAPMSIALGILVAATLARAWAGGSPRWGRNPVDAAGVAWAVATLLAAWFALDRAASLHRLGKGVFPFLVGAVALHGGSERQGRRAIVVLLASSIAASLYGLAVWIAHGASFADRARGLVGHYMTFGGQLQLICSVAVAVALYARDRRLRVLAGAAAGVGALALAATFTRSSWIGFAVALAVMLAITRPRWLPALGVALLALALLAPAPYRNRLRSAFDPSHPYNRQREYMWRAGLEMFRDHPITGVGLMDLKPIYDRYRPPEATERAGHLHDVPIQVAATMGIVGLAALVLLVARLFAAAGRGLRATLARGGLAAGLRLGVVAALAGFMVAGLFEWNLGDEELLDLLYLLVGLAWAARAWPSETAAAAPDDPAEPA